MRQKTILVTGASSGIGFACAQNLHQKGYRVFATARKTANLDKLNALGIEALTLDINDSAAIKETLQTIIAQTALDALFSNCGCTYPGAIEDLSRDTIRQQFEINVFGSMELIGQTVKIMRTQGYGRIVQTGSLLGYVTLPLRGAYNASKFALEGFIDTLRQELHESNIYVSLIEPGPIYSQIRENAKENFLKNINYEDSRYKETYEKMIDDFFKVASKTPFYLPPDAVYRKLLCALESKKPKARYYVGIPAHLFAILKRILPTPMLDWVLWQLTKKEMS